MFSLNFKTEKEEIEDLETSILPEDVGSDLIAIYFSKLKRFSKIQEHKIECTACKGDLFFGELCGADKNEMRVKCYLCGHEKYVSIRKVLSIRKSSVNKD
jgi:hypothetical protein